MYSIRLGLPPFQDLSSHPPPGRVVVAGDDADSWSYSPSDMTALLLLLPVADFDGHMDWGGGWGLLMVIGMVLFWGVVIVGIVWLLREIGNSKATHAKSDDDPLGTLDRRLAEGAISPDDYRERRAILDDQVARSDD